MDLELSMCHTELTFPRLSKAFDLQDFVRSLAPDYEIPEAGDLAGLVDGDIGSVQQQH